MSGVVNSPAPAVHRSGGRLRAASLAIALAALSTIATAGPAMAWDAGAFSPADEQLLFSLTNQDRASAGLNALVNDSYLHTKAEWRAKDMGDRDYFSHQIPPGNAMVFTYMQQDGYCFKVAGENIGLSTYSDDSATSRIETAFMGSTSHRENILGTWARMGVGAYKAADGRKLYAVLFSIPCSVTVSTPAPVTTPPPADGPAPTRAPTPRPTPRPTPKPAATPTPTPTPTPSPSPAPTPAPTPAATPSPRPTTPVSTVEPSLPLNGPTGSAETGTTASLRVREKPAPAGPLDAIFHLLFGGIFGG